MIRPDKYSVTEIFVRSDFSIWLVFYTEEEYTFRHRKENTGKKMQGGG